VPDLSVIIPARNEVFLAKTVENVLENMRGDTEVIAICDAYWPDPPLVDHPRVTVIHHTESIGQRAATNQGARVSQAKYVMKLDAHCAVDEGFDVKLMEDCQPDWTLIPSLAKLHAFDWQCEKCGNRTYQGSMPDRCAKAACGATAGFRQVVVWEPKPKPTYSWRFDDQMQFQYWRSHHKRPEWRNNPLVETMSCNGPAFFMERERFLDLGGVDEAHGSWGQYGTELACKAWLSGGKMVTTRNTWFAHLFRTGNFRVNGESAFPYPMTDEQQERAKRYSRNLWLNDNWDKATRPLSWLVERFAPVPGWEKS
jgi:glycosyltransferase involved in cell wall biosynthesis